MVDLLHSAEEILYKDLMFMSDPSEIRSIDLRELVDDICDNTVGYSFIIDRRNNNLQGGREKMLNRLKASSQSSSLLKIVSGRLVPEGGASSTA